VLIGEGGLAAGSKLPNDVARTNAVFVQLFGFTASGTEEIADDHPVKLGTQVKRRRRSERVWDEAYPNQG